MAEPRPASLEDYTRTDLGRLVAYLLHLDLRLEDAKDVAAETVKRMCEEWPRIENPKGWARATAYRIVVDKARARRSEDDKNRRAVLEQPSCSPAADDLLMLKDEYRIVIDRIRQLPPTQRRVIALHLDGFSNPEIAEITGAKLSTVASNLRHAKRRLAAILAGDGVYTPPGSRGVEGGGENDRI